MMSASSMSKMTNFQFASASSSSIKLEEETVPMLPTTTTTEKQGIVSILIKSDSETNRSASSLRRTLSADMSSKKWLAQNGFNKFSLIMKKIASSEELLPVSAANSNHSYSSSSSSEFIQVEDHHHLKRPGQDHVWRSIQSTTTKCGDGNNRWTWGSILFEKNENSSSKFPPPYIPPQMRRSKSSLSEKSLEICTESLGSETGSDGFSSYPPSEAGDAEEDKENEPQPQQQQQQSSQSSYEDLRVSKYNSHSYGKKMGPRSFPPPLPSLAREDGASVHMQSHRQNGRLVLEAVSVPSQNYFQAHREDGRLRLSFVNDPTSQDEVVVEEFQQVFDNFEEIEEENDDAGIFDGDDDDQEEGEEEEEEDAEEYYFGNKIEIMDEINPYPTKLSGGGLMQHVHNKPTTTIMMKKLLLGVDKKNLAWSSRFNKAVNLLEEEEEEEEEMVNDPDSNPNNPPPLPQSLPPPPRVARLISNPPSSASAAAAASFNAYDYFWREKKPTMAATIIKPHQYHHHDHCPPLKSNNQYNKQVILAGNLKKGYEQQNLVVMRGGGNKAEYLVPLLRRCNESRRSLSLWEPYCIAT